MACLCASRLVSALERTSAVDVIEIDPTSFATVLEYCTGDDLDMRLKRHGRFAEVEARAIIVQVLRGLLYLNVGDVEKEFRS